MARETNAVSMRMSLGVNPRDVRELKGLTSKENARKNISTPCSSKPQSRTSTAITSELVWNTDSEPLDLPNRNRHFHPNPSSLMRVLMHAMLRWKSLLLSLGCALCSLGDILKLRMSKSQPGEINQTGAGRHWGGKTQTSVFSFKFPR